MQGRRHRSGIVTGLALADEPTFHNVFRLPVNNKVSQEIRSHFINHGADIATSCHSGIQHEGHTQVCPRNKRRQTMDCPHCVHLRHRPKEPHTVHNTQVQHNRKLTITKRIHKS